MYSFASCSIKSHFDVILVTSYSSSKLDHYLPCNFGTHTCDHLTNNALN